MYEKHFGLSRRPFPAKAAGSDVFIGPQTAKFMATMKKGFVAGDGVVAVTGEAGVGKSTLVHRAINVVPGEKLVIRFARMQLGHDEVLDYLLEQFGAKEPPKSTIKKINLFQDLLAERIDNGKRVIVILEDAVRIGEDALAEFESLTSAGDSGGANIVMMGEDALLELLQAPALRRLNQRTRLRFPVQSLSAGELLAYLKHCFRNASGEFDLLFEQNAAGMLFELSHGNPRVVNTLVESMLTAAAEQKASKVSNELIATVAREEFGLNVDVPEPAPAPVPVPEPQPGPEPEPEPEPEPAPEPEPEPAPELELEPAAEPVAEPPAPIPELIQDTLPDLAVLAPGLATPSAGDATADDADTATPAEAAEAANAGDDEIPTLFNTGQLEAPDLEPIAVPELSSSPPATVPPATDASPAPVVDDVPELSIEPDEPADAAAVAEPELTLEPEPSTEPESPAAETAAPEPDADGEALPEWDRDPTLAELRPDIEALEQAMADFEVPAPVVDEEKPAPVPDVVLKDPTLPGVPEITLDVAIEQKINEAQEALDKTDGMIPESAAPEKSAGEERPEPKVGVPPPVNPPAAEAEKPSDTHIEKIAQGLANAKSIDDVDDQMAETLFGAEFSELAAQVVANAPEQVTNDPMPVAAGIPPGQDIPAEAPQAAPANPAPVAPAAEPANAESAVAESAVAESAMEQEFKDVYGEDALEVSLESSVAGGGLDISASQRLATVRALNADKAPGAGPASNGGSQPAPPPEPIEDQINTSMTATLKALGKHSAPPVVDDDDDDQETGKTGFFSRFKRS